MGVLAQAKNGDQRGASIGGGHAQCSKKIVDAPISMAPFKNKIKI
jgi:hypothetical protein